MLALTYQSSEEESSDEESSDEEPSKTAQVAAKPAAAKADVSRSCEKILSNRSHAD